MKKAIAIDELSVANELLFDIFDFQGRLLLRKGSVFSSDLYNSLSSKDINTVYIEEEEISSEKKSDLEPNILQQRTDEFNAFIKKYNSMLIEIQKTQNRGIYKKPIQKSLHDEMGYLFQLLLNADDNTALKSIFHVKMQNPDYSYSTHALNVALMAGLIGKWLEFDISRIIDVAIAGCLHDIGESKIPGHILNKKGSLSPEEWIEVKKHPVLGAAILNRTDWLSPEIISGVLKHHERLDGTGYPHGCPGSEIPQFARIIAVAGSFDALTINRPHKKAVNIFSAITELRDRSFGQLDAGITRILYEKILKYYMGSRVELSNGKQGIIVLHNWSKRLKPVIKIGENDYCDLIMKEAPGIKKVLGG